MTSFSVEWMHTFHSMDCAPSLPVYLITASPEKSICLIKCLWDLKIDRPTLLKFLSVYEVIVAINHKINTLLTFFPEAKAGWHWQTKRIKTNQEKQDCWGTFQPSLKL